jgi:hypothetical protein
VQTWLEVVDMSTRFRKSLEVSDDVRSRLGKMILRSGVDPCLYFQNRYLLASVQLMFTGMLLRLIKRMRI